MVQSETCCCSGVCLSLEHCEVGLPGGKCVPSPQQATSLLIQFLLLRVLFARHSAGHQDCCIDTFCHSCMLPRAFVRCSPRDSAKGGPGGQTGKMLPPVLSPSPLPIPGTHEETPISASRSMDNLSLTDRRRRWCTTTPRAGWETIPQVNPPRYVPLLHVAPMPPMRVLRVHISQRILARKQIFESRP